MLTERQIIELLAERNQIAATLPAHTTRDDARVHRMQEIDSQIAKRARGD